MGSLLQEQGYSTGAQNIVKLYYHQNHLGTTDYLTDNKAGDLRSYAYYDDWGRLTDKTVVRDGGHSLDLVAEYTGHAYDQVLDLYYAKARMYDAADRRFMAVDLMKGKLITPATFNPYIYCLDNSLRWVDLLGLYKGDRPVTPYGNNSNTIILPNGEKETLKDTTHLRIGYVRFTELMEILDNNEQNSHIEYDWLNRKVWGFTDSYKGTVNFSFYPAKFTRQSHGFMGKKDVVAYTDTTLGYFAVLSCFDYTYVALKSFANAVGFGVGLRFYIRGSIGADGLLPKSGSEPKWDYTEWIGDEYSKAHPNHVGIKAGVLETSINCYAYALDLKKDPFTGYYFEGILQPGALSSGKFHYSTVPNIPYKNPEEAVNVIFEAARRDAWAYGNDFAVSDKWEKAPAGMYKVALALKLSLLRKDYHWYRQDSNGEWSHKMPFSTAKNVDNSSNKITDPENCDRGQYGYFGGFFITGNPQ
jgi:RHS repeat-associated protein